MQQPKVSIIVPVYGVELYLDRCLQSLLRQTLKDIEIILVDDGSPDRCPQMCDVYALKDCRIKVIHKNNSGLGEARNSGLEIATGEYIAFVDSDDYVENNMYECLYDIATNEKCDIVYSGFKKETGKDKFIQVSETLKFIKYENNEVKKLIPDFIAAAPYEKQEYIYEMSVWHSIYKSDIIFNNNIRFVTEREYASEDIIFQVDMLSNASCVAFIPDVLYIYCFNSASLTKTLNLDKYQKLKNLYNLLLNKTSYFECSIRISRLFVGFVRAYLKKIIISNIDYAKKIQYIKSVMEDEIWNKIKLEFKPNYLPFWNNIALRLIYNRRVYLFYIYMKFILILK